MEDSWLHSAVEVFRENSLTSGVWTNTASSLVPRVNIEQSKAGYLKMVGNLTKSQDYDVEVDFEDGVDVEDEDGGTPDKGASHGKGGADAKHGEQEKGEDAHLDFQSFQSRADRRVEGGCLPLWIPRSSSSPFATCPRRWG